MFAELRMTTSQYDDLRSHLLADDAEHAAILVCGSGGADRGLLVCREVVLLEDEDLEPSSGRLHLDISPIALARIAKRAAMRAATLVVCHSHPFPGTVRASRLDLRTEGELCGRVLPSRTGRPAAALILGPDGNDGRLWRDGVPERLVLRVARRAVHPSVRDPLAVDERDARSVLVWGDGGQRALRDTTVAVVGVGGTGSHVVVQLAHLGIGKVVLVDPDHIEATNLNRVVGAVAADVGRSKVEVLARAANAIRPELVVDTVAASLLDIDAAQLASSDLVICCTDGHGSRAVLAELAAQYLVPLIDLGVEIQPAANGTRAGGGVRVIRPGGPCLQCMGILDPALVREEFLTDAEREKERRRGYLRESEVTAPSVVAINGAAASLAVTEALDLLLGLFVIEPVRLLYRAETRSVTTAAVRRDPDCYVCGETGLLGLGDARRLPRRAQERASGAKAV